MAKIGTVGIVGFGVMGAAIGLNAASSGYRVIYKELNDELVRSMYDRWVKAALGKRVAKGKMTQQEMDQVAGMISGTADYKDLAACDLVIEAVHLCPQIESPKQDTDMRPVEIIQDEILHSEALGDPRARGWHHLTQPSRARVRLGYGLKQALLTDKSSHQKGIQLTCARLGRQ